MKVDDTLSRPGLATTGCPQGTVLGSLCFSLFIDQLKFIIPSGVEFCIYADDVKLFTPVDDFEAREKLQGALDDFHAWSDRMGLRLSTNKCGVFHMGARNHRYPYFLEGTPLERLATVKDLGVRYSSDLSFSEQVDHVVKKSSRMCNWLTRVFTIHSPAPYLKLYCSLVVPVLTYASPVWQPGRKGDQVRLQRVQNRFLRRVEYRCGLPRRSLSLPDIHDLHRAADLKFLRDLTKDEESLLELFDLTATNSRAGAVLKPKAIARTERTRRLFPWRVVRHLIE